MKRNLITLELRHVVSSSARIVQLAKTKAITHFSRAAIFVTQRKSLEIQTRPYCKTKNPVELKRCKTPSSYTVYNLMRLKPHKERQI